VLRWQPRHARAHLALAESYLRLFDLSQKRGANPMSLSDVRDAILKAPFPSQQALEAWLQRAVGEHWTYLQSALAHTREGLRQCPLQGEGYLFLSELCFLEGAGEAVKNSYVEQALLVRPYDGDVLYAVAQQALRSGNPEAWLDYLHRSFAAGLVHQQRLLSDLVSHTAPAGLGAMIEFLLEEFQPDLKATRAMYYAAAGFERPERFAALLPEEQPAAIEAVRIQLAPLRQHVARLAEAEAETKDPTEAAPLWLEAQQCYGAMARTDRALECGRRAMKCSPNNYDVRYQLALTLIDRQEFAEAERHLQWCLQRKPDERRLERRLKEALRGRLDQESGVMSDRLLPHWR
jgi:tetratricopeptide (TPR) repeat protein